MNRSLPSTPSSQEHNERLRVFMNLLVMTTASGRSSGTVRMFCASLGMFKVWSRWPDLRADFSKVGGIVDEDRNCLEITQAGDG